MEKEKEKYTFNLCPKGSCDFNKIYNPESVILTYTNIETSETISGYILPLSKKTLN